MIDKDDSTCSVVYSLLKINSKAYIFDNILKFLKIYRKYLFAWVMDYSPVLF